MGWMDKEISRRCSADSYFILSHLIRMPLGPQLPYESFEKIKYSFSKRKARNAPYIKASPAWWE